tara:strand:+ start:454 stop:1449 length:996 start_codon:yes stop_codon:yes gene_type:complete
MSILLIGDCLDELKDIQDNSVDLIFCDLPYGQTSCKWDCIIPIDQLWIELIRVKKLNTAIIMTTTTKFGLSLLNSCPKKCPFRYDLVWCKSAPCGFLSAKKMPMRKHELIYVFYEKLPFYDLSSHTHKFIKETPMTTKPDIYGRLWDKNGKPYMKNKIQNKYDPSLPTSLIKEDIDDKEDVYNYTERLNNGKLKATGNAQFKGANGKPLYDPPLPTSLIKEDIDEKYKNKGGLYSKISRNGLLKSEPHYDPPLPDSLLEIKSTRGKHSTEKPVALMEWILKYYSKEGDVILDPTMGSGSMGVACNNMKRNFIGIEKDEEIYKVALNRINPQ